MMMLEYGRKNKVLILLLFFFLLAGSGCSSAAKDTKNDSAGKDSMIAENRPPGDSLGTGDNSPNATNEAAGQTVGSGSGAVAGKSPESGLDSLEGKFESKMGVMVRLSCFCYNCGYITTADGKTIAVCFEDNDDRISCTTIIVYGKYKTKTITPEANGACQGGSMDYFAVEKYKCK